MIKNPQLYTLSNGIQVVLDPWASKTCAMRVCFLLRPDINAPKGLAHFCEHMVCNSGARFPDGIHTEGLSGCQLNGLTNDTGVCFGGEMFPNRVKLILDVISDGLTNRVFRPEVLERERNAVRDEFYRETSNFILTEIFPGVSNDKCLQDYVMGTVDSINSFTNDQVVDFINRNFTKSNCVIVLSGRIAPDILNYIAEKFDCLPAGPIAATMTPAFPYTPCTIKCINPNARRTNLAAITALDADIVANEDNKYKWGCHTVLFDWIRANMRTDLRRLVYASRLIMLEDISKILLLMMVECQPDKHQAQELYAQMAQTCYRSIHTDHITKQFIDICRQNERLEQVQLMSDASARCKCISEYIMRYMRVPNWQSDMKMVRQLKRKDIIENTRDVFCPDSMSHAIQGQNLGIDLKSIWQENFGPKNKILLATSQKDDKIH